MTSSTGTSSREPSAIFRRFLDVIERAGNKLPDPLILFFAFAAIVPVVSWVISQTGWTLQHPTTGAEISVVNLLQRQHLQRMFTDAVTNFTSFPPLGTVLVAMLGIGVAERSGFIAMVLRMLVTNVPRSLITGALVFAGVMSSMATDTGYIVLTPLGAVLFASIGRHPIAGLCAAFAGVSGGFSANLIITPLDPLLSGLTQAAAQVLDPQYEVLATANYYLMIASVGVVTVAGWIVTDRIVEPRLGKWDPSMMAEPLDVSLGKSTPVERRALWAALASMLVVAGLFCFLIVPENGVLRAPPQSPPSFFKSLDPFFKSLVLILSILFIVPGIVYGALTGSVRNASSVAKMTGDTIGTMGSYIVLAFAAAQFVEYFKWSNLGLMLALSGAQLLESIGLGAIPLLLGIVLLSASINLFIGSASAKWALMAPVIVPLMMRLGFSPEMAQAAYRVGDSVTNIITPLLPYFPIIIAFAQKYDSRVKLGTLISSMLPYSIAFALCWAALLIVWYLLGLPLGPDAPMRYGVGE